MAFRHHMVVLEMMGSKTTNTEGRMNMLIRAEMMAPRDSIRQMLLTMSMVEISATPRVEQKKTRALVRMETSDEAAAIWMASLRSLPFCSSSWNRVVIRMA